MAKKYKNSTKKKLSSAKTVSKTGKKRPAKVSISKAEPTTPVDRDIPLLLLLIVIIAIPVLGPLPQFQGLPWVIRLAFLLPVLPLLLLFTAYKKTEIKISLQPAMLTLWAIVIMGLVSSAWAVNMYGAITGTLKWFSVALMSILVYNLARDTQAHRKLMIACALAGGYMALMGVTQYLTGHEFYVTPVGQYPWPSSTSGHKNMASQFVVMTLPFAIYLSITAKISIGYWLANPLVALMMTYIVYGRARQAFVALVVQLLVVLLALVFARSRRLLKPQSLNKDYVFSLIASVLLFVGLVIAPPFNKSFSWQETAVGEFASRTEVFAKKDASLEEMSSGRIGTWVKTANMIRQHPAGVGLNNWTVHYPKYNVEAGDLYRPRGKDVWGDAHNDYLQMLAELGLVALLIAVVLLFGLWRAYRHIWTQGDDETRRHSLFVGLGLMGLFTLMMFSFPLTRTATPVMMGVFLGLVAAMALLSSPVKMEKSIKSGPAILVILLIISSIGAYLGFREASGWNDAFLAKAIGERAFQPVENNPYANRRTMLMLEQLTDDARRLAPHSPMLQRDYIATYTNLSVTIEHERLAEENRKKALETAENYLAAFPYDSQTHMIVATRLKVPEESAIEHIGKAIELDPGNLQQFEYLKAVALANEQYDEMLNLYEFYLPRFYNQNVVQDYAYIGNMANQQERVLATLEKLDLSKTFSTGSEDYKAAKQWLELIEAELKRKQ